MVILDQGGLRRGSIELVVPPPSCAELVEHAWIDRFDAAVHPCASWRVVADASAHVIVTLGAGSRGEVGRAAVVGARSTFADIDVAGRRFTLGVRLRPGVLPALARVPATALTDRAVDARDVLGAAWTTVVEVLGEHGPRAAMDRMLTLLRRPHGPVRETFAAAQDTGSVAALARALGLPLRTLHQKTREQIGLGPKRLLRILRLHRALVAYRRARGWAEAAAISGYADQPHLVRELRALLGETPTSWIARGLPAADSFKTPGATRS